MTVPGENNWKSCEFSDNHNSCGFTKKSFLSKTILMMAKIIAELCPWIFSSFITKASKNVTLWVSWLVDPTVLDITTDDSPEAIESMSPLGVLYEWSTDTNKTATTTTTTEGVKDGGHFGLVAHEDRGGQKRLWTKAEAENYKGMQKETGGFEQLYLIQYYCGQHMGWSHTMASWIKHDVDTPLSHMKHSNKDVVTVQLFHYRYHNLTNLTIWSYLWELLVMTLGR